MITSRGVIEHKRSDSYPNTKPVSKIHIDVSHTIENGLVTYKGLPAPVICDYLSREASKAYYAEGTSFQIAKIEMVSNTGTYIDSPFHRYEDGKDLSELDLESVAGVPGIVIRVAEEIKAIGADHFSGYDLLGKAVLIHTNWSRHWNTAPYYEDHPFVTEAAAVFLKDQGVTLVGIDAYNIDDTAGNTRPVHSTLLGAEIPIVEHLCQLEAVPDHGFSFYAVPVKVKGCGTFPVRAFAEVDR
jgi:arylformamidase